MVYEKIFLNGKNITRYIKETIFNKHKDMFCEEYYEIRLLTNTEKDFNFLNYLGDADFIENRLEYCLYKNGDCIKAETYSFAKEDVEENNSIIDITFSEKDKIIKLLDKIDELEKEKIGMKPYWEVGLGNTQIIHNILELLREMNYSELAKLHNELLNGKFREIRNEEDIKCMIKDDRIMFGKIIENKSWNEVINECEKKEKRKYLKEEIKNE